MRFHGGLPCDVLRNGNSLALSPFYTRPLSFSLSLLPSSSLARSLSLSFFESATSTYFRITRNWRAATAAMLLVRLTKQPPWLTSAADYIDYITRPPRSADEDTLRTISRGREFLFMRDCLGEVYVDAGLRARSFDPDFARS